jgi:hypothetical protein
VPGVAREIYLRTALTGEGGASLLAGLAPATTAYGLGQNNPALIRHRTRHRSKRGGRRDRIRRGRRRGQRQRRQRRGGRVQVRAKSGDGSTSDTRYPRAAKQARTSADSPPRARRSCGAASGRWTRAAGASGRGARWRCRRWTGYHGRAKPPPRVERLPALRSPPPAIATAGSSRPAHSKTRRPVSAR